ncbi:acyl-CoA thioesterase [Novosphingobium soli]|uniref:Acyl-CoA thioesterase n=1 Tax=Novosphingobium soli TaxID=574956 RepID=A0ABV6D0N7_9SPHN
MPKPEPALLDPQRYPFSCSIEPRFGDLDVNLHINNVALAGLLEDGRVRFHRASGYREGLVGLSSMIVSVAIEYLGEGHYPDPLTLHCAVEDAGRTSHRLVQLVTQQERIVAFARSTMVTVDTQGPAPLPATFLERVAQWRLRP